MRIKLDNNAKMPTRAHADDAGLDIYAKIGGDVVIIAPRDSAIFDSGVHVEIPRGYVGMLKSKSGLNVKYGITSTGTIDSGYTGSIAVKLYNNRNLPYAVYPGDKISQLVIMPIITPELELVEDFDTKTERGENGFGSTGR